MATEEKAGGLETVESINTNVPMEKRDDVVEIKTVRGSEAYNEALLQEKPPFANPTTILLFLCTLLGFFCQTLNGFDGSLFGGLTANKTFLHFFHGENKGIWAGIVSSMYQIGSVACLPFVGPAIDTWGRRWGMFIGSVIVILGTVITGTTIHNHSVHQFMGGRFLLGFGVSIVSSAGPIYVVETTHPYYRSLATAYCNTFWFTGSILASGAIRGGLNLGGNTSWQLPVWLQLLFPGLIAIFCFLVPESPRWTYVRHSKEKATQMLTKWHGYGNPQSSWVKLQLSEYEEFLNMEGTDKRWWDYRGLFGTRASRYRLASNCCFSIFAQCELEPKQHHFAAIAAVYGDVEYATSFHLSSVMLARWCGNSPLSYFLPAVLDTAGYHNSITQANIQLGYSCFQFVFALAGARFVEKIGRRPLMLTGMIGCSLVWVAVTASTGIFANSGQTNGAAAQSTIAFIFIFGAVYSFNITPLQALYPVEVLSFEMRAKGMAFSNLAVSAGGLLGQFAWPVALKTIAWHTYIIFIVWTAVQAVIWYFFLPETKKRTLEELDQVFNAKNPVKFSTQVHKLALNEHKAVVAVEDV